jgi:exodeoxyribonuclease VII small subunit
VAAKKQQKGEQEVTAPESPVSFERSIQRLAEIVEHLEEGEQPLEESLQLFEEGMKLARTSEQVLERAERRIEQLLGVDAQGKPVVQELDAD